MSPQNEKKGRTRPNLFLTVAATVVLTAPLASAQVELPRRSPRARVSQQVGLTEITVDYNSPAVRGRPLWGAAVPFGKVWRSEENPGWRITFSRPVVLADRSIPAGAYSLLAIPGATDWTLVVNRNADLIEAGRDYQPELDLARIKVPVKQGGPRERLTFLFSDFSDEQASLDLEWEKIRLSLPIRVHTREQILASIKALDDTWRSYANLARYVIDTKKDYEAGLEYIDKSLALEENPYNVGLKKALLAALASKEGRGGRGNGDTLRRPDRAAFARPSAELQLAAPREGAILSADRYASAPAPVTRGEEEAARPVTALAPTIVGPAISIGEEPAARPSGRSRGIELSDTRRSSEIAPVIRSGAVELQGCYQRALRQSPSLARGKVTVSVTVGPSGLARSVELHSPNRFRVLEPCITEAVYRWTFPPSPTEYKAEFPIVLRGND